MILAAAFVLACAPRDGGLARVIDKRGRSYSVHLEIDDDGTFSTSDYTLEVRPYDAKRDKPKNDKTDEKPKPGTYVLRLTNLRWKSGQLSRRQDVFGSGTLVFGDQGFPSEFLASNWILSLLLGFYVPGAGVTADVPVVDAEVGSGWRVSGLAHLDAPLASGVPATLIGTLTRADGTGFHLTLQSLFDAKSGWPTSCSGTIQNGSYAVSYRCKQG